MPSMLGTLDAPQTPTGDAPPSSPSIGKAPGSPVEQHYRVLADAIVPRKGSSFVLRAGKVISSQGYDVEALREMGVKLEETDPSQAA